MALTRGINLVDRPADWAPLPADPIPAPPAGPQEQYYRTVLHNPILLTNVVFSSGMDYRMETADLPDGPWEPVTWMTTGP